IVPVPAEIEAGEYLVTIADGESGRVPQPDRRVSPRQRPAVIEAAVRVRRHARVGVISPRDRIPSVALLVIDRAQRAFHETVVEPGAGTGERVESGIDVLGVRQLLEIAPVARAD